LAFPFAMLDFPPFLLINEVLLILEQDLVCVT
jgi:hypothetical protein